MEKSLGTSTSKEQIDMIDMPMEYDIRASGCQSRSSIRSLTPFGHPQRIMGIAQKNVEFYDLREFIIENVMYS